MTGIRKVPANFRPNSNRSTNLMPDMEPYVGLITLQDQLGRPHSYARTAKGYHVPIECMTHQDIQDALRAAVKGDLVAHGL
jgi:hypothetical protein